MTTLDEAISEIEGLRLHAETRAERLKDLANADRLDTVDGAERIEYADGQAHAYGRAANIVRSITRPYTDVPPRCTGYIDPEAPSNGIQHDGDTCPVHEVETIGAGGINQPRYTERDTIPSTPTSGRHGHPGPGAVEESDSELTRQQLADTHSKSERVPREHSGPIPPVDDDTPDNDTGDEHDYQAEELRDVAAHWRHVPEHELRAMQSRPMTRMEDHALRLALRVHDLYRPQPNQTPAERQERNAELDRLRVRLGWTQAPEAPGADDPISVTLDAMEPAALIDSCAAAGIALTIHPNGLTVTLNGPRAAVHAQIVEQWGEDDEQVTAWTGYTPPKPEPEPLTLRRAMLEAADACETLAGLDEGEHTDWNRLQAVADMLRRESDARDSADAWTSEEA